MIEERLLFKITLFINDAIMNKRFCEISNSLLSQNVKNSHKSPKTYQCEKISTKKISGIMHNCHCKSCNF